MGARKTWHAVQLQDRQTGERLVTQEKGTDQELAELNAQNRLREEGEADRLSVVWSW